MWIKVTPSEMRKKIGWKENRWKLFCELSKASLKLYKMAPSHSPLADGIIAVDSTIFVFAISTRTARAFRSINAWEFIFVTFSCWIVDGQRWQVEESCFVVYFIVLTRMTRWKNKYEKNRKEKVENFMKQFYLHFSRKHEFIESEFKIDEISIWSGS